MGEGGSDDDVLVNFLVQGRGQGSRVVKKCRAGSFLFNRRDAIADIEGQADERNRDREGQKDKVVTDRLGTPLSCRHFPRPLCGSARAVKAPTLTNPTCNGPLKRLTKGCYKILNIVRPIGRNCGAGASETADASDRLRELGSFVRGLEGIFASSCSNR